MKAVVLLAVLACALGLPQKPLPAPSSTAAAATAGPAADASSTSNLSKRQGFSSGGPGFRSGGNRQQRNWGPKAYGPGLNNPWAFPPNPFVMQRAIALTNRVPGTLVRVNVDGEVQITDRHGFEVEIVDWFGNDITEGLDEFPESTFVLGGGGFGGRPGGFGGPGFF